MSGYEPELDQTVLPTFEDAVKGSRTKWQGTKWYGQNDTDKMVPIESSINQAIQLSLTIGFSSLIPLPLRPIQAYHLFVTCGY